ncbi:hypothetical protein FOCC_FOCC016352 [Frankliniella occidentalis]|nr:hypothetical protein FOCC_FOCC016352 [Frankliniella occidentalis]
MMHQQYQYGILPTSLANVRRGLLPFVMKQLTATTSHLYLQLPASNSSCFHVRRGLLSAFSAKQPVTSVYIEGSNSLTFLCEQFLFVCLTLNVHQSTWFEFEAGQRHERSLAIGLDLLKTEQLTWTEFSLFCDVWDNDTNAFAIGLDPPPSKRLEFGEENFASLQGTLSHNKHSTLVLNTLIFLIFFMSRYSMSQSKIVLMPRRYKERFRANGYSQYASVLLMLLAACLHQVFSSEKQCLKISGSTSNTSAK